MSPDNLLPDTDIVLIKSSYYSYPDGTSDVTFLGVKNSQYVVYVLMNTSSGEINRGNWKKMTINGIDSQNATCLCITSLGNHIFVV